jgi:hypothetical protein
VGTPVQGFDIKTMTVYDGSLYVGGMFDSIGNIAANSLAKWDGNTWSEVGGGVTFGGTYYGDVASLDSINGNLYVGGNFGMVGSTSVRNIAIWNNSSWAPMGSGLDSINIGAVKSIVSYQGDIYAAVQSEDTNGYSTYYLAKWDGAVWSYIIGSPYSGTDTRYSQIFSLLPYNGKLIASGIMEHITSNIIDLIAAWDGSSWSAMDVGFTTDSFIAETMDTFHGRLYAGGIFKNLGSASTLNIAEYCGASGIADIPGTHTVHVYPNPTTGIIHFTIVNIQPASSLQIYDLIGRTIMESTILNADTEINLSRRPAGTYLYRIIDSDAKSISSGRFIME